jgi:flagellar hook-length control protein FliK
LDIGTSTEGSTEAQPQSGGKAAAISQTLAAAAQAAISGKAAAIAGNASPANSAGAATANAPANAPSAANSTTGTAVLASTVLGAALGQTATAGYSPAGPSKPGSATGTSGVLTAQSAAMAAAVVGVLPSSPVAATTQTQPLTVAIAAPSAANVASSLPLTLGAPAEDKSASGDKISAATTSGSQTSAQPAAADAQAAAMRQNANQANHSSAATPGTAALTSNGDRARLVQRVARAFQSVGANDGSVKLRLSPPELGSLRIEIKVDGGQMTARLDAETPAARDTLLDNLPQLRDRLQQQDIKVVRFDVGLLGQSPGDSPQTPHRDFGSGGSARQTPATVDAGSTGEVSAAATTGSSVDGASGLNVVI